MLSIKKSQLKLPSIEKTPNIHDPNNFCHVGNCTYISKANYIRHLKNIHTIQVPRKHRIKVKICYLSRTPDINNPKNFCKACDHTFSSKYKYHYHLESKHAMQVPKNPLYEVSICYPNRTPDINDPSNFCNVCNHTFS